MNKDLKKIGIAFGIVLAGIAYKSGFDEGAVDKEDPRMERVKQAAYNTNKLDNYYKHFTNRLVKEGIRIRPNQEIKLQLAPNLADEMGWAGVSLGYQDDSIVWIIIDEEVLEQYNNAEVLELMYHEFSHDLLNEDHTQNGLMAHSDGGPMDMQHAKDRINEFFRNR